MLNFFTNYYLFFRKNYFFFFIIYSLFVLIIFISSGLLYNEDLYPWADGHEYIKRAKEIDIFLLDFKSLSDGYRTPLYPLLLNLLFFFSNNLIIAAKLVNFFCIILTPLILFLLSSRSECENLRKIYFIKVNILFFFLPNYFFLNIIYPETLSILIFNVLIYYLLSFVVNKNSKKIKIIIICALYLFLFYLKANLILISFLFLIILTKKNIKYFVTLCVISFLFILPWLLYIYKITGEIQTTTGQNINRLKGMGLDNLWKNDLDTMHGKYIYKKYKNNYKVNFWFNAYRNSENDILASSFFISKSGLLKREQIAKESSKKIWSYDKEIQIIYSLLKIPHLFGFNLRNIQDLFIMLYFFIVLIMSFFFRKQNIYKKIVLLNLLVLILLLLQTLFYFPTIRFSIYLINSSLLIISYFLFMLIKKKIN